MPISWPAIVEWSAAKVLSYDTPVTLRQLFYQAVSAGLLPNSVGAYRGLSAKTAKARRARSFPDLIDRTRVIHRDRSFNGSAEATDWLQRIYRRDRTEGQDVSLYLGVEKNGIVSQLDAWFGDLGIPIIALGGYSSQSFTDDVARDGDRSGRPAILIYAGDFDPSGEDIPRDFVRRTRCFDEVHQVALSDEQVIDYGLPPNPGKVTDSRASSFVARHGDLVQVELDALSPDILRQLYQAAIDLYWDESAYASSLAQEEEDKAELV